MNAKAKEIIDSNVLWSIWSEVRHSLVNNEQITFELGVVFLIKYINDNEDYFVNNGISIPNEFQWDNIEFTNASDFRAITRNTNGIWISPEVKETNDYLLDKATKIDYCLSNLLSELEFVDHLFSEDGFLFRVKNILSKFSFSRQKLDLPDFIEWHISRSMIGSKANFSLSPSIVEVFKYFVKKEKPKKIYNPFAGSGSLIAGLSDHKYLVGQELNISYSSRLAKLRLFCNENYNAFCNFNRNDFDTDSIKDWLAEKEDFDGIVSFPPFKMKLNEQVEVEFGNITNSDQLNLFRISNSFSNHGIAVIGFSSGVLFRGGIEQKLRKNLIDLDIIEYVIQLPEGLFYNTKISSVILVINTKKKDYNHVTFVDASELKNDFTKYTKYLKSDELIEVLNSNESPLKVVVSKDDIIRNDYNLSVGRYFLSEEGVSLEEVCEIRNGERNKASKEGKLLRVTDLSHSQKYNAITADSLDTQGIPPGFEILDYSAVIVSTTGGNFNATEFVFHGDSVYIGPQLQILVPDEKLISRKWLVKELNSKKVKKQLKAFAIGTSISKISRKDLANIRINVPKKSEQKEILFEDFSKWKDQAYKEIGEKETAYLGAEVADENSFLRHKISGKLKNLRSAFEKIDQILNEQASKKYPEILNLKLNESSSIDLKKYLEIANRDLRYIHDSVKQTGTEIRLEDMHFEEIDVIQFFKDYSDELLGLKSKGLYRVVFNFDEKVLEEAGIDKILIQGDKNILREMLDNLESNAVKHAFANGPSPDNLIDILIMIDFETHEIQVDFANSGIPFPENFDIDNFKRRGSKAGKNAGSGEGGWFINEVMKKHGGKLTFTDETGDEGIPGTELVSSFELHFPVIITYKTEDV